MGGHFTEPYEQNTQQSPGMGRNTDSSTMSFISGSLMHGGWIARIRRHPDQSFGPGLVSVIDDMAASSE